MAKMAIDFPMNLEKINPKSGPPRRFSTGNGIIKISEPLPIPNYLRASIGSCHDFCKYGAKRQVSPETITTRHDKIASVVTNKGLGKKKLVPVPLKQQPSESKAKPLVRSDQSSLKQLNKPILKSTKSVQTCHDHAGNGTRSVPLKSSPLPRSSGKNSLSRRSGKSISSPEKDTHMEIKKSIENSKTCQNTLPDKQSLLRRSSKSASSPKKDNHLEIKKYVEKSKTCQNTLFGKESLFPRTDNSSSEKDPHLEIKKLNENSETCETIWYENVPEKIIHVVEPNDENREEDVAMHGSHRGLDSSRNQKQDSEAKSKSRTVGIGEIVPKESDSSSRELKIIKSGKTLEIENVEAIFEGKSLRRVVLDEETTDPLKNVSMRVDLRRNAITQKTTNPELMNDVIEETAGKLISKNKVKALVDAFEYLNTFQDFESPMVCTRAV